MKVQRASARVRALDAMRGLAILGMALSGMVPWDGLPAAMYHAQEPPPDHSFSELVFGITWVDLVFPFFLFAMGIAIPLALSQKLDRGEQLGKIIRDTVIRGGLLAAFAIVGQHFRPQSYWLGDWKESGYFIGVICFGLMCLAWARFPKKVDPTLGRNLTLIGVGGIILALFFLPFKSPAQFDLHRFDIILMVLANVSVSGTLIWLATRGNLLARLGWATAVLAIFLTAALPGPGKVVWDFLPFDAIRYVYHFEYQKYLMLVIPGTICGDILVRISRKQAAESWQAPQLSSLFAIAIALPVVACGLLLTRQTVPAFYVSAALLFVGWFLSQDRFSIPLAIRSSVRWGSALLLIGLLLEPVGGGIRKDSPTLSYFFVTAGLGFWMIVAWLIFEHKKWMPGLFAYFADAGANPMLAYIAITNLIPFVIRITFLNSIMNMAPLPIPIRLAYSLFQTFLVGAVACWATRKGFYLRA